MNSNEIAGRECASMGANNLTFDAYTNRETNLGDLRISRALPIREHRLVGPWCFLDRFGPLTFSEGKPMNVPPHPHIGLQTVTWLLQGEVLHTDSIDSEAIVRPGGVNIMTAGDGIAHAETTPTENSGQLNGVQLWVALPDEVRKKAPAFEAIPEVPIIDIHGGSIRLFAGSFGKTTAPGRFYSEQIGMDLQIQPKKTVEFELNTDFEHAALILNGDATLEDQSLIKQTLYYLGTQRACLSIQSQNGCRLLLIGGSPFNEKILMWWNFVARTPEEIQQARIDWEEHRRFGKVRGKHQHRLKAPSLNKFAHPNPVS